MSEQQTDPVTASGASLTMAMEGAVAVLSLGHAPYNLMDEALNTELVNGLEWSQRQGARAVILRSSLRHFSAGADLDQMVADAATSDVLNWGFAPTLRAAPGNWRGSTKPCASRPRKTKCSFTACRTICVRRL